MEFDFSWLVSVSADNKRDRRTIEEVLADTRAKKRMKTESTLSSQLEDTDGSLPSGSESATSVPESSS